MIALVRRKNEQGVALVDAVMRQAREELAKGIIIGFELRHITSLAWPKGAALHMVIMSIGNVRIRDRHSMLLHCRHISKRHRGLHAIKAGEANMGRLGGILDDIAVQVLQWPIGTDYRRDVLMPEQGIVPCIATRLIGQTIGYACIGA